MIRTEIELLMPDFSKFEFSTSMEKISKNLELSEKTNFLEGGRPKWLPKKNGEPAHLFKSGKLFQSITSGFTENEAWAGMLDGHNPIYGFAHQFGYTPRNLVARPFILFQDEDKEMAINVLGGDIVEFWETKGEPI
jgi:phage gpG-like protein